MKIIIQIALSIIAYIYINCLAMQIFETYKYEAQMKEIVVKLIKP
jgi:hypothetical protein